MSFTATQYLVNCSPGGDLHQRRRYFISFVEDVLERGGDLDAHLAALDHWYKIKSLSDFKSKWHRWVLESSQLR
jgi:hypothetical protein